MLSLGHRGEEDRERRRPRSVALSSFSEVSLDFFIETNRRGRPHPPQASIQLNVQEQPEEE